MDVIELPEGKSSGPIVLMKHAGPNDSVSTLHTFPEAPRFLAFCRGFIKVCTMAVDCKTLELSRFKLRTDESCWILPDGSILHRDGIIRPNGKHISFDTPRSIKKGLDKVEVMLMGDPSGGVCGLLTGDRKYRFRDKKWADDALLKNTLLLYSLSDGSFLKSVSVGAANSSASVLNGKWIVRTDDLGITLFRAVDHLKDEVSERARIAVPGAGKFVFSADMLRVAVSTETGVHVYELEWELEE